MEKSEIAWAGIDALRGAIERGALSAREVTEVFLARVDEIDPDLGAFVCVWNERARASARRLDERQAAGDPLGPLHGIPIGIKDLFDVAGEPTRAGMSVLGDAPADRSAHAVERLEAAGAVLIGKTKLTEGAFVAHHPDTTRPVNPWCTDRWTGISSSGSGVAVAAGLCTAALGTDTGGSIRFPSAACALTGLKPTHGRISLHGVFPFAPSFDTVGPMARSVQDAATLFAVLSGRDLRDGWSVQSGVADPAPGPVEPKARRVRIGVDERLAGLIVDRDAEEVFMDVLASLRELDAELVAVNIPDLSEVHPAWLTIASAELALSHAATYPARAAEYGPELRIALEVGRAQSGATVSRAWQVRQEFRNRLEACFEGVDVLIAPVFPGQLAFDVDLLDEQTFQDAARAVRLATPFSVSGSPVLTLPGGLDRGEVPFSFQLVGPRNGEARLLALGEAYQTAHRWHRLRPERWRPAHGPNSLGAFRPRPNGA